MGFAGQSLLDQMSERRSVLVGMPVLEIRLSNGVLSRSASGATLLP